MRWGALAIPIALGLASCTGDTGDAALRGAPFSHGRQLAISDQLHNSGTAGFVFLPPMVPRPAIFGDFLPDLEPIVRVDELDAAGRTVRTLATFTRDSGPGRERIRVHHQGRPCDADDDDGDTDPNGYFYARWRTNHERLSTSAVYRVRVFVQERVHPCTRSGWGRRCRHGEDNASPMREIGFADVDVVRNHPEVRAVDRAEFVPLVNGHTLRIKFRIDRPVVDADGDGVYNWRDNCRTTANASQLDTNNDGEGDACECAGVTCTPSDACHVAGTCNNTNGMCSNPAAPDGSACALANATAACTAGACGVAACNAGFADCDGSAGNGCEQPTDTLAHCGGCNVACAAGAHSAPTCATGTCGLVCDAGWYDADGDRANGCELDITTDANCGAPGNACVSGTDGLTTCVAGACSTMSCGSGRGNCNTAIGDGCEVDLTADAAHCGICGTVCATPNATPVCAAGACAVGSCNPGFGDCDGSVTNGCEVNTQTSLSNCGACGRTCSLPNAAPVCTAGACAVASCNGGFADVNRNPLDGCEVNLATDPSNCGSVGNACSATNGTAGCAAGLCTVAACNTGYADCDTNPANGCERDLRTDDGHCGTCGNACPSGANSTASCAASACVLTCAAGFDNCDGNPANGCEVTSTSDRNNCGGCGITCDASQTCQAGVCSAPVCTAPMANCDGLGATGCEVDTSNTAAHCGACNHACGFPNAAADCVAGACTFTVCNTGYGDIDGVASNGCEVNFNTDPLHCGGQNRACTVPANGSATCTAGVCGVACAGGFTLCGGACVDATTSAHHCGACGNACAAGQACTAGACVAACPSGQSSCPTGCVNLQTDAANCGVCGRACGGGEGCVAGSCRGPCGLTTSLCGGVAVDLSSDEANCGACGTLCASGQVCLLGSCRANDVSCAAVLASNPAAASGAYTIDPDGVAGPVAPFTAWCDMTGQGGGWTLVYAARTGGAGGALSASAEVTPASGRYVPTATMRALANVSAQFHMRTAGRVDDRSATSVCNALPIVNLRLGVNPQTGTQSLTTSVTGFATIWTTFGTITRTNFTYGGCGDNQAWPTLYWACNNGGGAHTGPITDRWGTTWFQTWNARTAETIEAYLR